MKYFKEYLYRMFSRYIRENNKIPIDFVLNYYVGIFAETVVWLYREKMKYTPKQVSEYYILLNQVSN